MEGDEHLETLLRIEHHLRTQVRLLLVPVLKSELKTSQYRKLYDLTGEASVNRIAQETGFSTGKISGIWQAWEQLGLVYKSGKSYKKSVD